MREVGGGLDLDDQDQFTREANDDQMVLTPIESVLIIFVSVCILFNSKLQNLKRIECLTYLICVPSYPEI
jgi:hypothetical protein